MADHYLVNLISKEDYDIADEALKDYVSKDVRNARAQLLRIAKYYNQGDYVACKKFAQDIDWESDSIKKAYQLLNGTRIASLLLSIPSAILGFKGKKLLTSSIGIGMAAGNIAAASKTARNMNTINVVKTLTESADTTDEDFLDDTLYEDESEFEDYLSAEEAYYLNGDESVFYMCLEEDLAVDSEDRYAKMSVRNLMRKFRQIEKLTKQGKLREAKALANEMNMESNNVKKAIRKFRNKQLAKKVLKVTAILAPVIGAVAGVAITANRSSDTDMQNIGNAFKEAFGKLRSSGSSASASTPSADAVMQNIDNAFNDALSQMGFDASL